MSYSSPEGKYFRIPKLGTNVAAAGTSAEAAQQVEPNWPLLTPLCPAQWQQLCLTGPIPAHHPAASLRCPSTPGERRREKEKQIIHACFCFVLSLRWGEACSGHLGELISHSLHGAVLLSGPSGRASRASQGGRGIFLPISGWEAISSFQS